MANKVIHSYESIMPLTFSYSDTDMGGVIHHASYLCIMERARDLWFKQLGFDIFAWHKSHLYFAVRSMKLDYYRPVTVWEGFEMTTQLIAMTRVKLTFRQHIHLAKQPDVVYFNAEITTVAVDDNIRPSKIPEALRKKLEVIS